MNTRQNILILKINYEQSQSHHEKFQQKIIQHESEIDMYEVKILYCQKCFLDTYL